MTPGRPRVTRILLASGWGRCRGEQDVEELDPWPEGPSPFSDLPPLATTSVVQKTVTKASYTSGGLTTRPPPAACGDEPPKDARTSLGCPSHVSTPHPPPPRVAQLLINHRFRLWVSPGRTSS